jgi:hypothetical protein
VCMCVRVHVCACVMLGPQGLARASRVLYYTELPPQPPRPFLILPEPLWVTEVVAMG